MALTTRATLAAAVADWLNRSDLTTAITADFIPLAEAEMRRRLRRSTESTTIFVSSAAINPPSDMAAPISLHLDSGSPSQDRPLRFVTPEMLAERLAAAAGVAGRPDTYAYYDGQFQFAPEPDQSYDGILLYYQQLTPLTADGSTNTILSEAPDAYLFGTLLQAASYLEHDERIPVWQSKFDAAIEQLNKWRDEESYSAGRKDVRLPIVFG
jgi:hypothetical protein